MSVLITQTLVALPPLLRPEALTPERLLEYVNRWATQVMIVGMSFGPTPELFDAGTHIHDDPTYDNIVDTVRFGLRVLGSAADAAKQGDLATVTKSMGAVVAAGGASVETCKALRNIRLQQSGDIAAYLRSDFGRSLEAVFSLAAVLATENAFARPLEGRALEDGFVDLAPKSRALEAREPEGRALEADFGYLGLD